MTLLGLYLKPMCGWEYLKKPKHPLDISKTNSGKNQKAESYGKNSEELIICCVGGKDNFEELNGKKVSIAGRIMAKRVMGKASFCNVQDLKGNIQLYVAKDSLGEESYADFKKYDIGDIIGVEGEVFETQKGEKSIHAETVTLLSKSLQILPEKYHGLTNTDIRYRQRYTDLIMNEDVKETFIKRS